MRTRLAVLRARAGGYVGDGHVHPALVDAAREAVSEARGAGRVTDGYVARCGDDLALVLTLAEGSGGQARAVAREAFLRAAEVAGRLGQHDAWRPERNGALALESVELGVDERPSEPVLCFLADKAGPGTWNLPLYRMFADPFNTPRLCTDPALVPGFRFVVADPLTGEREPHDLPSALHLMLARLHHGWVVREVVSRRSGAVAAVASGGEDPVLVVRCHGDFPTVGEALEAFSFPHLTMGWGDGYAGPLMPVGTTDDPATRFDGPPRAIGLGFQLVAGRLVGPRDLLGDRAFEGARRAALRAADYLRRHGPLGPRRLDGARLPLPVPP